MHVSSLTVVFCSSIGPCPIEPVDRYFHANDSGLNFIVNNHFYAIRDKIHAIDCVKPFKGLQGQLATDNDT